ncbi:MAG: MFS transporter [Actinomycetota bacterium]|nr:MFS transporter [Actinomycetota bacterium]
MQVIVMLAAVLGLSAADTGAIGSLAAPLEQSFHIGNTRLGLLVTVTTVVGVVATLPFGALADRLNRIRVLQAAVFTWGSATAISACSVSYTMLLITRIALGVLVAAAGPLVVSLAGDLFPANERGRLFGLVLSGELIGGGFGIVAAGTLSGVAGWRPALAILAVPAVVLVWELRRHFPEPARGGRSVLAAGATTIPAAGGAHDEVAAETCTIPLPSGGGTEPSMVFEQATAKGVTPPPHLDLSGPAPDGLWSAVRYVLRVRTNVALIVASGFGYFFLQGLETFAELFFRDRYGVGQSLASVLFVFIALSSIIGVLAGGRIADGLIRRGHSSARLVVAAVAFLATPAFFAPGVLTTTLAVSLPLFIIAGAAIGAVNPPLDSARFDIMPSTLWGRAEAVRTTLRTVLQGAAPLVFGFVSGAFGASNPGIGAGIATSRSAVSGASGHGLALAFLVLSTPLLLAGAVLAADRHRYLRDVVAANRMHFVSLDRP